MRQEMVKREVRGKQERLRRSEFWRGEFCTKFTFCRPNASLT